MDDDDVLADRVDIEPPIFKGCASSELLALLLLAVAVWIPLALLIAVAIGKPAFSLGILAVGVIASVFLGAEGFQRVKRNRPDHYYMHAARRWLHMRGAWSSPITWRSGLWDIDRS